MSILLLRPGRSVRGGTVYPLARDWDEAVHAILWLGPLP
jgi:hypothetical protein